MQHIQPQQPLLITVSEALAILKVGRTKFYRLINDEGLPVVKSGRWIRLSPTALQRWIEEHQQRDM